MLKQLEINICNNNKYHVSTGLLERNFGVIIGVSECFYTFIQNLAVSMALEDSIPHLSEICIRHLVFLANKIFHLMLIKSLSVCGERSLFYDLILK